VEEKSLAEALELRFDGEEKVKLLVRAEPAVTLTSRLACTDGRELPIDAELRLCGPTERLVTFGEGAPCREVHRVKRVALGGRQRDRLEVGALPAGTAVIAIRPSGFDRWTFTPGTEKPREAGPVALQPGDPVELGLVEIDCAPSARVVAALPGGSAPPDLTEAVVDAAIDRDGTVDWVRRIERLPDVVVLRDLPEAALAIDVALRHPFLVPGVLRPDPTPVRWTAGRGAEIRIAVPATVGGVVEIESSAPAARLVAAEQRGPATPGDGTRVRIVSIPTGRYRAELCGDPACTTATGTTDEFEIGAATVVRVLP
jgi:hypothetical protein